MDKVLKINNLDYESPDIACVIRSTRRAKAFPFPTKYENCIGNEKIEFLINTGGFIDTYKSSLALKLRVNAPVPQNDSEFNAYQFDFDSNLNSNASILNLISEIYLESRDGSLIYRQNYVNMMQTVNQYIMSNQYKNNTMTLLGGIAIDDPEASYQDYVVNKDVNFNIPMWLLGDFFNTSQLLHPNLSGSKLTIILANPKLSIVGFAGNGNQVALPDSLSITISDISLNLQQCELYDGIQAVLKSSLLGGLKHPFYNNYNSKFVPTSSSFTYNVQFAASIITYVAVKFFPRNRDLTTSPMAGADVYQLSPQQSDTNALGFSIRARLNGKNYPTYNITTATQAYVNTIQALTPLAHSDTQDVDPLRDINNQSSGCIPYSDYCYNSLVGTNVVSGNSKGGFIIGISLEKNRDIGLSGDATTASKTVSLEIEGLTNYDLFDMYVQLQYLSIATIYENNIIVSK